MCHQTPGCSLDFSQELSFPKLIKTSEKSTSLVLVLLVPIVRFPRKYDQITWLIPLQPRRPVKDSPIKKLVHLLPDYLQQCKVINMRVFFIVKLCSAHTEVTRMCVHISVSPLSDKSTCLSPVHYFFITRECLLPEGAVDQICVVLPASHLDHIWKASTGRLINHPKGNNQEPDTQRPPVGRETIF